MSVDPSDRESLRRSAAIHEAGHAVVAWALGLRVRKLGIGEEGKGKSCIEDSQHLPILEQIAVAAAGMEAVDLLRAPTWGQAGMSDALKIMELLEPYPDEQERHRMEEDGHKRALEILTDRRALLSDLGEALARTGLLGETALAAFAQRSA